MDLGYLAVNILSYVMIIDKCFFESNENFCKLNKILLRKSPDFVALQCAFLATTHNRIFNIT